MTVAFCTLRRSQRLSGRSPLRRPGLLPPPGRAWLTDVHCLLPLTLHAPAVVPGTTSSSAGDPGSVLVQKDESLRGFRPGRPGAVADRSLRRRLYRNLAASSAGHPSGVRRSARQKREAFPPTKLNAAGWAQIPRNKCSTVPALDSCPVASAGDSQCSLASAGVQAATGYDVD